MDSKLRGPKLKYKGSGKGDKYRPVDREKYRENYEKIFGKKKP